MLSTGNLSASDGNWEAGKEESKHLSSSWKSILDTDHYKRNVYYHLIALEELCGFKKWTVRASRFLAVFLSIASRMILTGFSKSHVSMTQEKIPLCLYLGDVLTTICRHISETGSGNLHQSQEFNVQISGCISHTICKFRKASQKTKFKDIWDRNIPA